MDFLWYPLPLWLLQHIFHRISQALPNVWLWSLYLLPSVATSSLSDDNWARHKFMSMYSRISLETISLTYFLVFTFCAYHVWFYPMLLGYLSSGSWPSRQCQEWVPSFGMGLKLPSYCLTTPTISAPPLLQHILLAGQIVGRRFCVWVDITILPLEVLPGYKRWPVQAS